MSECRSSRPAPRTQCQRLKAAIEATGVYLRTHQVTVPDAKTANVSFMMPNQDSTQNPSAKDNLLNLIEKTSKQT